MRVPTVSGDEGYVGLGQGPPTHTDLGEGLADSETGRVLGTGGAVWCPWGLGLSIVFIRMPSACKPWVVTGQRDPMREPHLHLLRQLTCLGWWGPRRVISNLRAPWAPGLVGFGEGHPPGPVFPLPPEPQAWAGW